LIILIISIEKIDGGGFMDIKNLLTFIQVAELNSFTKAAKELGYSQSTVSTQIKQLETELNAQLFERIYHTLALTNKGKEVLRYAHQMVKLSQELKVSMQDDQMIQGTVRIALADSLCYSLLNDKFLDFTQQYPHISLKIIPADTEEMFRLVNHNEVDIMLTLDSHIYNTEYVIVKEEKIATHFIVSSQHPLAQKESLTVQELIQYPFILTEKGMSYRRIFDERLAEVSLEVHPVLELGSTHLICSLVEQGDVVSLLPDYVTQQSLKAGRLKYLEVKGFHIEVWKQLLYHRDKWLSPHMETVISYCIEQDFNDDQE